MVGCVQIAQAASVKVISTEGQPHEGQPHGQVLLSHPLYTREI